MASLHLNALDTSFAKPTHPTWCRSPLALRLRVATHPSLRFHSMLEWCRLPVIPLHTKHQHCRGRGVNFPFSICVAFSHTDDTHTNLLHFSLFQCFFSVSSFVIVIVIALSLLLFDRYDILMRPTMQQCMHACVKLCTIYVWKFLSMGTYRFVTQPTAFIVRWF